MLHGWRDLAAAGGADGLDAWSATHLADLAALEATWSGHSVGRTLLHIYFDGAIEFTSVSVVRNRFSRMASDHLPLVADFIYLKGVERPRESPGAEVVGEA